MRQAPRKRSGPWAHFIGGTIAHPFVFCNGGLAGFFLDGWSCCGLRPLSAKGLVWPAPLSHLPTLQRFWKQGDSPCTLLGEMRKAPSFHLAHRPTLLGTGGLTILLRKQRPLRPAWGRRGTGTLPRLPPYSGAGRGGTPEYGSRELPPRTGYALGAAPLWRLVQSILRDSGRRSAVHRQELAGDIVGVLRGKEHEGRSGILRLAEPTQRNAAVPLL